MKYAVTGHTDGIGKALYQRLSPNCVGFSLTTGHDINNKDHRRQIINQVRDCDIFINNAAANMGQTYLFIELFQEWKNKEKLIINVGSRISEIILPLERIELLEYQAEKISLKYVSDFVSKIEGTKCKVNYRWFSYVGTEKILKKYPHFTKNDYISLDEACDIILS